MAGVLEKPFSPERLIGGVHDILTGRYDTQRLLLSRTIEDVNPDTIPRPSSSSPEELRLALSSALQPPEPTPEPVQPLDVETTRPPKPPRLPKHSYHAGLVLDDEPTHAETLDAEVAGGILEIRDALNPTDPAAPVLSNAVPGGLRSSAKAERLAARLRRHLPTLDHASDTALTEACEKALRDEAMFGAAEVTAPDALLAGRIGDVTVPHIVQLAENLGFPVWVRLDHEIERIDILVHGQQISFARQHNLPEVFRLGRFLVELGAVDVPTINRMIRRNAKAQRLGQNLAAAGLVSIDQIDRALQRQVQELVCEAVGWTDGQFSIFRCTPIPKEALDAEFSIHTTAAMLEGMRRIDEWRGARTSEDLMFDSWSSIH